MKREEILRSAIARYGTYMQIVTAMEEMAELTKELSKHIRYGGHLDEISEEIADVRIMLDQLQIMFDCAGKVKMYEAAKVERLRKRLEEANARI